MAKQRSSKERRIYMIRPSTEEDRPRVSNNSLDFDLMPIGLLREPLKKKWKPPRWTCEHPDALEWDFFLDYGTPGILSQRAVDALRPYSADYFEYLLLTINGAPYYFIRIAKYLDCFDRERSTGVFEDDEVHTIDKFEFRMEAIPIDSFFCIKERFSGPFGTDAVVDTIRRHKLKGFRIRDTATEEF